jgi:hypothetical protein
MTCCYDCVSGPAVNVGVTMYVLSISSLSEVEMVQKNELLGIYFFSLVFLCFCLFYYNSLKNITLFL